MGHWKVLSSAISRLQKYSRAAMIKAMHVGGLLLLDTGKLHALWDVMVLKLLHNDSNEENIYIY